MFSFLLPHIAYAAPGTLGELAGVVVGAVNAIVPVLVGLGVVLFLWGVLKTMTSTEDAKGKQEGKKVMIYGIISLFIIISLWGILRLAINTLF